MLTSLTKLKYLKTARKPQKKLEKLNINQRIFLMNLNEVKYKETRNMMLFGSYIFTVVAVIILLV